MLFVLHEKSTAQNITITPKVSLGTNPNIYKSGIFLVPKTANAGIDFIKNGVHHNALRLIAIEDALNFSQPSVKGVMALLESLKPNILYVNSRCDKLIIPILKMPLWLSSSTDTTLLGDPNWRKYNAMPPASYTTWNILMDSIVSKINGQWGLDPYYEIWNEPDNFYWQDSPAQYFRFFKNTYFAIKKKHPSAKVGGPVLASFTSKFGSAYPVGFISNKELDASIMGTLIDSCVAWNARLDFVSWHKFDSFLYSVKMEVDYLNQKLIKTKHGIVPYIISEWNNAYDIRESGFAAAFMPNYILALEQYGIAGQVVAAWQDFDSTKVEFHHDYGMLSWGALHKPEWKSLLLFDKLKGTKVQISNSDYLNLAISATRQNNVLRVLISNRSVPAFTEATSHLLYNHHFNATDLSNAGLTAPKLDSVYRSLIPIRGNDKLSSAINSVIPVYQKADSVFRYGRNINLTISGLKGRTSGTEYLIDKNHNNLIYSYDSLLNTRHTRQSAISLLYPNHNNLYSKKISVTDSVYSFHMQPNAVLLLEFYLPEASGVQTNITTKNVFEIYHKPYSQSLTVTCHNQSSIVNEQLQVYNSVGILIKTINIKLPSTVIDISNLATGLYYVYLKNKRQVTKFMKQ